MAAQQSCGWPFLHCVFSCRNIVVCQLSRVVVGLFSTVCVLCWNIVVWQLSRVVVGDQKASQAFDLLELSRCSLDLYSRSCDCNRK